MNKLYSFLLILITSFSIFAASTSFAGNRAGAVTATVGGGYDYLANRRQMENTGLWLAILGYNFTNQWALEAFYGGFNTDFERKANDDRTVNGSLFLLDVLYRLPVICSLPMVEPFVLAGTGVTGLNPNRYDAHNEGNFNVGLGTQIFANKNIAFRAEARDVYTRIGGKNDVVLDAGVSFLFDV